MHTALFLVYPALGGLRDLISGSVGALLPSGTLAGGRVASSSVSDGGILFPPSPLLPRITDKLTVLVYADVTAHDTYGHLLSIGTGSAWLSPYARLAFRRDTATSALQAWWYDGTDIKTVSSSSGAIGTSDGMTLYALTLDAGTASFYRGDTAYGGGSNGAGVVNWGTPHNITLFNRHGGDMGEGIGGSLRMAALFADVLPPNAIHAIAHDPTRVFDSPSPLLWRGGWGVRFFSSTNTPAPPVASFTAAPTSGVAPLNVAFADTSSGAVTARLWDFDGDGIPETADANPSHTYTTPGTYTARLTVSNSGGSDEATATITAQPQPAPAATPGIAYTVEIDFDRDGTFAHADADVTAYVTRLRWSNGMSASDQSFAPPARLEMVIDMDAVRTRHAVSLHPSPLLWGGVGGGDTSGALLRLRAAHANVTHTLWQGKITRVEPAPGVAMNDDAPQGEARITAEDPLPRLLDSIAFLPLHQNVTVDAALRLLFDTPVAPYPYDRAFWIMNSSALGSARLYINTISDFETGITRLRWVGDTTDTDGISAQRLLRDWVAAEAGGRFWWDAREGAFRFVSRHHDALTPLAASYSADDLSGAVATLGDDVANVVSVAYQPRTVGAAGTVIWQSAPFTLRAGGVRLFTARYTLDDTPIAAVDVIPPPRGVDFAATANSADISGQVEVAAQIGATSAYIVVRNIGSSDVTISLLRLRGTPLTTGAPETVTLLDPASIAAHDRRERTLTLPAVDDAEFAADIARAEIARYGAALLHWRAVSFYASDGAASANAALQRAPGDRIHISDPATDHAADYMIVGERHAVDARTAEHRVTWLLKPLARERWFIVADPSHGELDGDNPIAL
jgi:PKD repeat protein